MKARIPPRSVLVRTLVFTVLWALVSENAWHGWPLIGVAIAAAVAASFALWPVDAWKFRFRPLLRFLPYFARESITGGIDVARRALSRKLPLDPALIELRLRLRSEVARVVFAWTVSLLPGTASVRLEAGRIKVHVLDRNLPVEPKLRQLEDHVAALFGEGDGPASSGAEEETRE